jgi:LAO/AO transport system kinase
LEHGSWVPPIVRTVATTGVGIQDLEQAVGQFWAWLAEDNRLETRRSEQWRARVNEMMRHELMRAMRRLGLSERELSQIGRQVALKQSDPYELIPRLVEQLLEGEEHGKD